MENLNNKITISGIIESNPEYSHEYRGTKYYEFFISSQRTSGTYDTIPCFISEDNFENISEGNEIELVGEIRTYNKVVEGKSKLYIHVFVREIYLISSEDKNDVEMIGYICKEPIYRKTPKGREICDITFAVNRLYNRSDYIPTILWGFDARNFSCCEVGVKLYIKGRLQSRDYIKHFEDGSEEVRTAYELSASYVEVLDGKQCC